MTRNSIHPILAVLVLIFSSCATILNSKKNRLTIITSVPSNLVIGKDTINNDTRRKSISVDRDKNPLIVHAYNDSLTKTVSIKSKNSFAYWLNLYPNWHFWTGFYIDTKTKKRYTYSRTIYIDLSTKDSSCLTILPLAKPFNNSNIIKLTPLKIIGLFNPSIELSFERITGNCFSTQIMSSYLLPTRLLETDHYFNPNIKGFRLSIEEKFYLNKSAPIGSYLSFEFNYLNNRYKNIWNFGVKDIYSDSTYNDTNYPDTFGIKKQTYNFNIKFGYQIIEKRLAIDFYAGLGLRYKVVSHYDRINPNDEMELPRHLNVYYIANREGKYWTVSIPLNVRIGWTF